MNNNLDVRTSLAISKGANYISSFEALISEKGISLDLQKGENHVISLFPVRSCDHFGSRAADPNKQLGVEVKQELEPEYKSGTSEHIIMPADCKLTMEDGSEQLADKFPLQLSDKLTLTYGQIIGLGGDFYGDPKHPVCLASSPINQFEANFNKLKSSANEIEKILDIIQKYEFDPISDRINKGQSPSGAFAAIPKTKSPNMNDEDLALDQATGGGGAYSLKFGRYTYLAKTNFDHFGEDALTCYKAGHALAQITAINAKNSFNPHAELMKAYAINAFADHFLTDLFAAGHIRTPRRKLFESATSYFEEIFAGLCAKAMHDEDNKFGLWVENNKGDKWVAYGDARYRDWCNAANRIIMKAALQQSMHEVYEAFGTGSKIPDDKSKVLDYLPKIIQEINIKELSAGHCKDPMNWKPLFWWDPMANMIMRRNDINDTSDPSFCEQGRSHDKWGLSSTHAQLSNRSGLYMPKEEYFKAGYPFPPEEGGSYGEIGWPAGPSSINGTEINGTDRVMKGVSGPTLANVQWHIDAEISKVFPINE